MLACCFRETPKVGVGPGALATEVEPLLGTPPKSASERNENILRMLKAVSDCFKGYGPDLIRDIAWGAGTQARSPSPKDPTKVQIGLNAAYFGPAAFIVPIIYTLAYYCSEYKIRADELKELIKTGISSFCGVVYWEGGLFLGLECAIALGLEGTEAQLFASIFTGLGEGLGREIVNFILNQAPCLRTESDTSWTQKLLRGFLVPSSGAAWQISSVAMACLLGGEATGMGSSLAAGLVVAASAAFFNWLTDYASAKPRADSLGACLERLRVCSRTLCVSSKERSASAVELA